MKSFFEFLNSVLSELGIDLSLVIAGFVGSLAMIGEKLKKGKKVSKIEAFVSVLVGMACAVYLTPIVVWLFKVEGKAAYGLGFICGYLGLRGVEMLINKFKKDAETQS